MNTSTPGGDHPDDTYDVSDGSFIVEGLDLESAFYRLAAKKGGTNVLTYYGIKSLIQTRDEYLAGIPEGSTPDQDWLADAEETIDTLYAELGDGQDLFWEEYWTIPDVAVLNAGFVDGIRALGAKIGEPTRRVTSGFSPDRVLTHPVMVIPSGGLYGMENSGFFKARLESFVASGGTLIAFAQQSGYEFNALPVPSEDDGTYRPVDGYGWQEDQACFTDGVYIETWHPALSSQTKSTLAVNVDGYFTSYPSASTVILSRTSNGQPAMVMYPYGAGWVVATSMYSDFAYAHGQASAQEVAIVRDLIAWAKAPAEITEVVPGELVTGSVTATNASRFDAAGVRIIVMSPERTAISTTTVYSSIPVGGSAVVPFAVTVPSTGPLGIWRVEYELLDAEGALVQPQSESADGRFAVSSAPATGMPEKDIWFTVTTPSQGVYYGQLMYYTFHVYNNTDEERTLNISYYFPHTERRYTKTITAAPNAEATLDDSVPFLDSKNMFETLHASLMDENGAQISTYMLSFRGLSFTADDWKLTLDKDSYVRGDTVSITSEFRNPAGNELKGKILTFIYYPGCPGSCGYVEYINYIDVAVGETDKQTLTFPIPTGAPSGIYTVKSGMYAEDGRRHLANAYARFGYYSSDISVQPILPDSFSAGPNVITFDLQNKGFVNVSSGVLNINLVGPDGSVVYFGVHEFAIAVDDKVSIDVPVSIPSPLLGMYTLYYTKNDETNSIINGSKTFDNISPSIRLTQDMASALLGGAAGYSVSVWNKGNFQSNGTLTIRVPQLNYSKSIPVSVAPGEIMSGTDSLKIPITYSSEFILVEADFVASDSPVDAYSSLSIYCPPLSVYQDIAFDKPTYSVRDTVGIHYTITNNGNAAVPFPSHISVSIPDLDYQYESDQTIEPGVAIDIPLATTVAETVSAGKHGGIAKVTLPSGQVSEKTFDITVPSAELILTAPEGPFTAGDSFVITVENTGGKDTTYSVDELYLVDGRGVKVLETSGDTGSIRAGESDTITVTIPDQAANGQYYLYTKVKYYTNDALIGAPTLGKIYDIIGQSATLVSETSEETYYKFNAATGTSSIGANSFGITGGTLDISVYGAASAEYQFVQYLPFEGGVALTYPYDVAVAEDGALYIAGYNAIDKLDINGNLLPYYSASGAQYLAVSPDGSLYFRTNNSKLYKLDANGSLVAGWGGNTGLDNVRGVAVDSTGNVYVSIWNYGNSYINKYAPDGTLLAKFYPSNFGSYSLHPASLEVSPDGYIYVSYMWDSSKISKLDSNGNLVAEWGDGVNYGASGKTLLIRDMAVSPDGYLYVTDSNPYELPYRVLQFDSAGNFIKEWTNESGGGTFSHIWGIDISTDGLIYVAGVGKVLRLEKVYVPGGSEETYAEIFESSTTVDAPGNWTVTVPFETDAIDMTGKLLLRSTLRNALGQTLVEDEHEFYVKESDVMVTLSSDKTIYKPGESMAVNGEVRNEGTTDRTGLKVTVSQDGVTYYSAPFDLPAGSSHAFSTTITAPAVGTYALAAKVADLMNVFDTVGMEYETVDPIVSASVTWPDTGVPVGDDPFAITVSVENTGKVRADVTVTPTFTSAEVVTLQPGESRIMTYTSQVTQDTTYWIYFSGDYTESSGQYIYYGIDSTITTSLGDSGGGSSGGEIVGVLICLDVPVNHDPSNPVPFPYTYVPIYDSSQLYDPAAWNLLMPSCWSKRAIPCEWFQAMCDQYSGGNAETVKFPEGTVAIDATLQNSGQLSSTFQISYTLIKDGYTLATTTKEHALAVSDEVTDTLTYVLDPGTYTLNYSTNGDEGSAKFEVVETGQGEVTLSPSSIYTTNDVSIPFTVENTGDFGADYEVTFEIGDETEVVRTYIENGASYSDLISLMLPLGNYSVAAELTSYPSDPVSANFSVVDPYKAEITLETGDKVDEILPVTVDVTNVGFYALEGSVRCSVRDSSGAEVWTGTETIKSFESGSTTEAVFSVVFSGLDPAEYAITVEFMDNGNVTLASVESTFTVEGPDFEITQFPSYAVFDAGEEAYMSFTVRNIGDQGGYMSLNLKAYDLVDATHEEWLDVGEEKTLEFAFTMPTDLESADYYADYQLAREDGTSIATGQVKYGLNGIDLDVTASLDKTKYSEGETAILTLTVQTSSSSSLSLVAKAHYDTNDLEEKFSLSGSQTLTFDIPLDTITGEKLAYGIYYESGRSIHLNSVYVYEADENLSIATDKQVYAAGETVNYTVSGSASGTLYINTEEQRTEEEFSGTAGGSFVIDPNAVSGSYRIDAILIDADGNEYDATHPYDVNGIVIKIVKCENDKEKYASSDTITTTYTISSNVDKSVKLKKWIIDPEGTIVSAGEEDISISSSDNLVHAGSTQLETASTGMHRLLYGVMIGDLSVASGTESFDVGDVTLLSASTDKTAYALPTDPVNVSFIVAGSGTANLEFIVDDQLVQTTSVSVEGTVTGSVVLGSLTPGEKTLKVVLTAGGLTSTKTTAFSYATDIPDLTVGGDRSNGEIGRDHMMTYAFTVYNEGKTTSEPTTLSIYVGDSLFETVAIGPIEAGSSEEHSLSIDVQGSAGVLTVTAVVDEANTVTEFDETNNTRIAETDIPIAIMFTSTDKDEYKAAENVSITAEIISLSTETFDNYTLKTSVTDEAGVVRFSDERVGTVSAVSSVEKTVSWEITSEIENGTYSISQTLSGPSGEQVASSSVSVEIKSSDFNISLDPETLVVRQGETAQFTGTIESIGGFGSPVSLSASGIPGGTTSTLSTNSLLPPGSFTFEIETGEATTPGSYEVVIKGEGEGIAHEARAVIEITAFTISADTTEVELMQLENLTVRLSLDAVGNYDGSVALEIEGVPLGASAQLAQASVEVPGEVELELEASKYARPGTYDLTLKADDGLLVKSLPITLNVVANKDIAAGLMTTEGPGPNNEAWVRVFDAGISPVLELMAFDTKYGTSAASADLDGDGRDEVVVGMGSDPKNPATIGVFNLYGALLYEMAPFDAKYGVTLSAGDLDGDWVDEVVAGMGPDPKNPSTLVVLKQEGGSLLRVSTVTAYSDLSYGVNSAVGDLDGDGVSEVVTAPGPGPQNEALIKVWGVSGAGLSLKSSFVGFEGGYGANVAVGDLDGDGKAEIIVGTGPDPKNLPYVKVFRADGSLLQEFAPYGDAYGYGAYVASVDLDGDGAAEIVTGLGPGPKNQGWVKVFGADGSERASFLAYPADTKYGVRVSSARPGSGN